MSTKLAPGDYDCYAKLFDDEPYFVLRAKDPDAPAIVEAWVAARMARGEAGNPKLPEALETAVHMRTWRSRMMSAQACGCDAGVKHHCDEWPNCAFGKTTEGRL